MLVLVIMSVTFAVTYVVGWTLTLRVIRADIRKPEDRETEEKHFAKLMEKLDCFSQLKDGWNGYDAVPPGESVNVARNIAARNGAHRMYGWEVFPTARSSVQLERTDRDAYTEIEVYADRVVVFREIKHFLYTESTEVSIPLTDHRKIDRVIRKGEWMPWIY